MERRSRDASATDQNESASRGTRKVSPVTETTNSAVGVANNLRKAILEGVYPHGEQLPAERVLADRFHVARGTIRRALSALEDAELITRRIGSGNFVNRPTFVGTDDVAERTSPLELAEARFAVEPHMARLAVINATGRSLRELRERLERVEAAENPEEFTHADCEFHLTLAECSQNSLMIWLYHHINEVRGHSQWVTVKEKVLTRSRMDEYNGDHRNLYRAVASRDVDQAVRIITRHLNMAREDLMGAESVTLAHPVPSSED